MTDYIGILSHEEAERYEVTQLSTSGCGVTALLNVLIALGIVTSEQTKILDWSKCILRTRNNDAPLPEYLLSRSVAGCTGQDIVTSLAAITESNTVKKFWAKMCLSTGYSFLIKKYLTQKKAYICS